MPKKDGSSKKRSSRPQSRRSQPALPGKSKDPWGNLHPDAKISASTFNQDGTPKVGDGLIFLKPGGGPEPGPGGDSDPGNPDPCRGRPFVATPLVAAKLDLASSQMQAKCPSKSDRQRIAQAVRAQFSTIIPNAE